MFLSYDETAQTNTFRKIHFFVYFTKLNCKYTALKTMPIGRVS